MKDKASEEATPVAGTAAASSSSSPADEDGISRSRNRSGRNEQQKQQQIGDKNYYRVEVKVESLRGILLNNDNDSQGNTFEETGCVPIRKAMATVAFGGSSSQMKVLSSSVCAHTGRPVIESLPFVIDTITSTTDDNEEEGLDEVLLQGKEGGGGGGRGQGDGKKNCQRSSASTSTSRCWLRADWNKLQYQQHHESDSLHTNSSSSGGESSSNNSCTTATIASTTTRSSDSDSGGASADKRKGGGRKRRRPLPHLTVPLSDKKIGNHHLPIIKLSGDGAAAAAAAELPPLPPPIPQMNRDSLVLQLASSEDGPDITGPIDKDDDNERCQYGGIYNSSSSSNNNNSSVWSADDAMMDAILPEIVELQIRIKSLDSCDDNDNDDGILAENEQIEPVGTAYLVLFGHEQDNGNYVMELPVKQRPIAWTATTTSTTTTATSSSSSSSRSSSSNSLPYLLTDQARLRVRVKVVAPPYKTATDAAAAASIISHRRKESNMTLLTADLTSTSTTLSNDVDDCRHYHRLEIDDDDDDEDCDGYDPLAIIGGPNHIMTRSQVEEHVGCLLQTIEKNELEAIEHIKAQKRAIDVEVPIYDIGTGGAGGRRNKMYNHHQLFSCGDFSSVWNLDHWWNTISDALLLPRRSCGMNGRNSSSYYFGVGGGRNGNSSGNNGPPPVGEALSMDSTIYTRDSMTF